MTDIILSIIEDESLVNSNMEWILLDPNRFLQIVINLVTNAIKFTRTSAMRKIVIAVSALHEPPSGEVLGVEYVPRRYSPANPCSATGDILDEFKVLETVYLSFSVTDTGKGLTSAEKALLFNRFAQASPKTHIEYGGSGLGLFISRQITEMLGGEIGMSSTSGGSIFAFYVKAMKTLPPRRPSVSIEPILQMTRTLSLSRPDPKTPPTQRHILVIEDNLVNQKVLCKLLRNRSFIVEAANHGQEALAAIAKLGATTERCSFDIILCDIEMPVMNGIEFAKEVRALESIGELISEHVPIIGVTANVRGQQVNAAIEAGMDGVTTKPYRIDELIGHIDRVCYMASGRNRESEESNTLG
ncbi:CheY-like superfamily [Xylariales sp. AK1849]|nr:CheY-like superfamily [Xylariales sp. AK1849]